MSDDHEPTQMPVPVMAEVPKPPTPWTHREAGAVLAAVGELSDPALRWAVKVLADIADAREHPDEVLGMVWARVLGACERRDIDPDGNLPSRRREGARSEACHALGVCRSCHGALSQGEFDQGELRRCEACRQGRHAPAEAAG